MVSKLTNSNKQTLAKVPSMIKALRVFCFLSLPLKGSFCMPGACSASLWAARSPPAVLVQPGSYPLPTPKHHTPPLQEEGGQGGQRDAGRATDPGGPHGRRGRIEEDVGPVCCRQVREDPEVLQGSHGCERGDLAGGIRAAKQYSSLCLI